VRHPATPVRGCTTEPVQMLFQKQTPPIHNRDRLEHAHSVFGTSGQPSEDPPGSQTPDWNFQAFILVENVSGWPSMLAAHSDDRNHVSGSLPKPILKLASGVLAVWGDSNPACLSVRTLSQARDNRPLWPPIPAHRIV